MSPSTTILVLILSLVPLVCSHGTESDPSLSSNIGMDMGGTASGGGMVPWLHFGLGDNLWFQSWVPQSKAALAGASIGLFLLAIVDRWIAAMRGLMEYHWRRKAEAAFVTHITDLQSLHEAKLGEDPEAPPVPVLGANPRLNGLRDLRMAAPFIISHDIPRGLIHGVQAMLGFLFMLAVMMFQAAWLIAIVCGLAVGEMLFGRFAALASHGH